ncbi:MAG: hypothetical protein F4018_07365 [Acidobacteria bacterium]|nr:hypothetical protein [Acidobacteriota bacterium]
MDDGAVALLPQPLHAHHRLLETEVLVRLQDVLLADADGGPPPVQLVVAVGHERAQAVVAAEPLEDDQDLALGGGQRLRGRAEQRRQGAEPAAEQAEAYAAGADLQCLAAGHATGIAQLLAAVGQGHGHAPLNSWTVP